MLAANAVHVDALGVTIVAEVGVPAYWSDGEWKRTLEKRKHLPRGEPLEAEVEETPVDDVSTLKAAELRQRLSARGLSTAGKKAELVERLQEALAEAEVAGEAEGEEAEGEEAEGEAAEEAAGGEDDMWVWRMAQEGFGGDEDGMDADWEWGAEPAAQQQPVDDVTRQLDATIAAALPFAESLRRFLDGAKRHAEYDRLVAGKVGDFGAKNAIVCLSFNGRRFDTEYIARGFVDAGAVKDISILPSNGLLDVTYRNLWHFRDARAQTGGSLAGVAKNFGEG
eukprot:2360850-Prymnesium_polylepis.1